MESIVKKEKISFDVTLLKNIIRNAIKIKGPKGIMCSLFLYNKYKDIGKAIKLAKKIVTNPKKGSNIRPKTNNSFTSPPPNDSFLNKILPSFINKYININKETPLINAKKTPLIPFNINFSINIIILNITSTSSGIII